MSRSGWVPRHAQQRADATYEFIDLAEAGLPLLDEAHRLPVLTQPLDQPTAWPAALASLHTSGAAA